MPRSTSHILTSSVDATNSPFADAAIRMLVDFRSSGTAFGEEKRDQILNFISTFRDDDRGVQRSTTAVRFSPEPLNLIEWHYHGMSLSSRAIIPASMGSEDIPSAWRNLVLEKQEDQLTETSSQQIRIQMVQVVGSDTVAFVARDSQFRENGTTPLQSGGLVRALRDLEEFTHDDWDAEGARGITPQVIDQAARVLSVLPDGIPEPDVAPARDGSVCMEWDSPVGLLWFDIGPGRAAQTLVKIGSLKEERRFHTDAPDLAKYLRVACTKLYPSEQNLAIRSVMVAA
jgi:hypothetical protein